jgi:hypothetical protein
MTYDWFRPENVGIRVPYYCFHLLADSDVFPRLSDRFRESESSTWEVFVYIFIFESKKNEYFP